MAAAELNVFEAVGPAVTVLSAGAAAALVSRYARVSPIVGYLLAGILIGPFAFRLLEQGPSVTLLAELGVVFLLFDIGLHISLREMRESRKDLLSLAPVHLLLTAGASTLALLAIGIPAAFAVTVGISLGLSSTAVVSRVQAERGLQTCPLGKSVINILIFQDIIAIFLLIFAASLGDGPMDGMRIAQDMAFALGQAVVAFIAAIFAGRHLVDPVFKVLAATRTQEAFTAFVLLLVLGAALATYAMGLSLTLGAFLAGLAVSGTPFRHQIQTETSPFRGLLLSFFFISVGLSIDLPALLANLPVVVLAAIAILIGKSVLGYAAARLNGWSVPGATQLGFMLGQGSEFTLVVLSLAAVADGLPGQTATLLVASIAVSMAAAPAWAGLGLSLAKLRASRRAKAAASDAPGAPATPERGQPVVVFGMTAAGRLAVDALREFGLPYVAVDNDADRFMRAVADGYDASYGDASNMRLIDALGANQSRAAVIGAPRYDVSRAITPVIESRFPGIPRFVSVGSPEEAQRFRDLGMKAFLALSQPEGVEMAAGLLQALGVPEADVSAWLTKVSEATDQDDITPAVLSAPREPALT